MPSVNELQNCQMEILDEIDRVCQKYNIKYCLAYGTCLGALRHKGFIPWDDDIDIYMYIDDYKKLVSVRKEFKKPFFFQSYFTDSGYRLLISRVRNSNTTLIEEAEQDNDINHGVFVDIYPLYNCPPNKLMHEVRVFEAMLCKLLLYGEPPKNRGGLMNKGSRIILKLVPKIQRRKIFKKMYKRIVDQRETGYISSFYGDGTRFVMPKEWFLPYRLTQFEDKQLPIPNMAEKYLSLQYGDFMKLPPVEKQVVHHEFVYASTKEPYSQFRGVKYLTGGNNS